MILRFQARICLFTKKREFVVLKHCYKTSSNMIVLVKSIDYENAPPVAKDSHRGTILYGGYIIEQDPNNKNSSLVTYISYADLKMIPNIDSESTERLFVRKLMGKKFLLFYFYYFYFYFYYFYFYFYFIFILFLFNFYLIFIHFFFHK